MVEIRLNPFLVSRRLPNQERMTCENPLGKTDFLLENASFARVAAALRGATGRDEILSILCAEWGLDSEGAIDFIDEMVECGILVDNEDPRVRQAIASKGLFDRYGWSSAFYFHNAVRNYPFLDYSIPEGRTRDYELMRTYLAAKGLPHKYKLYDGEPVLLEKCEEPVRLGTSLPALFECSESGPTRPLTHHNFSRLVYLTMGQIGTKPWPDQGFLIRRTSPSGGARHPTEAYIVILNIDGLTPGVYHYNTRDHGLDRLREAGSTALRDEMNAAAPDVLSRMPFEPKAVLFFTTIPERSMWRYRDSRSYRVLLIDLGHILATFRMLCCAMGIQHFVGQGIRENEVERLVGIDGIEESALHMSAIG